MAKALGLDLGTRTLGIAMSDSAGWYAYGVENFRFEEGNYKAAVARVVAIAKENNITELALGLPLHMNGQQGERAESCLRFKSELEEANPDFKIKMIDERMTTMIATRRLLEADLSRAKRKKVIDQQAAVVILESYLQMRK
ncbi:MAG: Holliday junction resolvase RuvX [Bacilli bacterium]|nr:Holliday junction resolvase RuvX [Bacilli bacterium]